MDLAVLIVEPVFWLWPATPSCMMCKKLTRHWCCCCGCRRPVAISRPQAKTALADTAGSVFVQKCIAAANEGRWDELIKQLSAHLDLVFAQCSDKGRCKPGAKQQP